MSRTSLTAVHGDITTQQVDAIVNAANSAMRGGGGVDGAIHRAGGPAVLQDCIARLPDGLPTGEAGWTTAGDLPSHWVIHTVGPNHNAGQTDRSLLTSCYRRSLEVAEQVDAGPGFYADTTGPVYDEARAAFRAAWDGAEPVDIGVGGSIPFVAAFAERFPDAAILVTGVEDPDTRAHGANESLHLGEFERVCVAETLLLARLGAMSRG